MMQPEPKKKKQKKSIAEQLPKMGRASRIALIVGVFLIVFVSLIFVGNQQASRQAELRKNIVTLQRGLSTGTQADSQAKLEAQIKQAEAETEVARAVFPVSDQAPEILDRLLKLAKANDIGVTRTAMTMSQKPIAIGGKQVTYDVFTFQLSLKGQVSKFQNFLLALGDELPTSQISAVNITVAAKEHEEDTASVTVEVLCYGGK
ncbi:MAG: hypothetical protein FJ008_05635 [Chloroflexi bacterium]|nr:hypothetical protein [Chloroflexota bacterium]MBM3172517.1 hypothetical protein [Chloroflexota bacterium]MBM4450324.1 hypothetical protein [Chloroflexota bacterium]